MARKNVTLELRQSSGWPPNWKSSWRDFSEVWGVLKAGFRKAGLLRRCLGVEISIQNPSELSVLKRCVPKTLAFAFSLSFRSKTRCFKTRVLGRRLPNGKPQERLRFKALRSKTLAFKKRMAMVFFAI